MSGCNFCRGELVKTSRSSLCRRCGVEWFMIPGRIGVRKISCSRYWDCIDSFSILVVVDEVGI